MKKTIISAFVIAISGVAHADANSEYFNDHVLNFSSDSHIQQAASGGQGNVTRVYRGDTLSEYFNDERLDYSEGSHQTVIARGGSDRVLNAPPAIGSGERTDFLDHIFPGGHID